MLSVINIALIFAYIVLLIFSLCLLFNNYICDNKVCGPFIKSLTKSTPKDQNISLLESLCSDGMWPFAFIASSILSGLFFATLPVMLTSKTFTISFLLGFLVIYSIMSFFIHHYVYPIKNHIIDYIRDDNQE